jgi:hypothetical protein
MKKNIFYLVAISAVLITSCRKIEMDGEKKLLLLTEVVVVLPADNYCFRKDQCRYYFRKANTYILKDLYIL